MAKFPFDVVTGPTILTAQEKIIFDNAPLSARELFDPQILLWYFSVPFSQRHILANKARCTKLFLLSCKTVIIARTELCSLLMRSCWSQLRLRAAKVFLRRLHCKKKIGLRGTERSCHKHLESKIRSQLLHHLPPPPTHEGGVNPGAFKPLRKFKNKIREAIYGEISNSECSH